MSENENKSAAVKTEKRSAETVTVACKLPHGIIMHLDEMVDVIEQRPSGSVVVKMANRLPQEYKLNGAAHYQNKLPEHTIVGNYGLTFGIPKDFWDEWLKQNEKAEYVKNGLIFAATSERNATAEAKEKKDIVTGFERLDPAVIKKMGLKEDKEVAGSM